MSRGSNIRETAGRSDPDLRALLAHLTCPHCWQRFPTRDIAWVAKHEDLRGDPVLGQDHMVRFQPSRFNVAAEALDARGMACQNLACPRCHLLIPRVFLEYHPLFLSIIGLPVSGKSYFLAAMAWQLRRVLPEKFSLAFTDADITGNQVINGYENTLFQHGENDELVSIKKTEMEGELYVQITLKDQTVLLPRPFLFTMRPTGNHRHAAEAEHHSRMLCLYDNAGEHFLPGADTSVAPGTQHMARSKVLMFLFDPTQAPRFREECQQFSQDPQLLSHARTTRQDTILTEAALRVRQHAGLSAGGKLDKPLLVLISKSDVWDKLIEEDIQSEPFVDSEHSTGAKSRLDFARIERVSKRVRDVLLRLTPEFVAAAEDAFQQVVYIPVSALGRSPEPMADNPSALGICAKDIRPRWVTVPVLYAFGKWATGLINSA